MVLPIPKHEFLCQVNVTDFEASHKCSSNPLKLDIELGPATLAPGEWEESEWGSNATVRPDPRPVWQKTGEPRPRLPPKPKDWNDIVWSSETKVRACDKR